MLRRWTDIEVGNSRSPKFVQRHRQGAKLNFRVLHVETRSLLSLYMWELLATARRARD